MTGVSPPAAARRTVSLAHRVMPADGARAALSGPGEPVAADRRQTIEEATGLDLHGVRLHTGTAVRVAARAAGAAAFTLGRDIGIAVRPGQPIPQPLLQHELVHAAQQLPPRVPGAARAGATPAQAEEQAARLGLGSPGGPSGTQLATVGSHVACAPEDWLTSTPDLRQYGLSELLDELRGIDEWLARQTATTPDTDRMFESKAAIESQIARLRGAIDAQDRPRRGPGKGPAQRRRATSARSRTAGTSGATHGGVAAGSAAESSLPDQTPMPRVLRERSSRQLTDPAELRQEVDAIAAWLQRQDLSKSDGVTLRAELMSLAPQLGAELDRTSALRRQSRLNRAFSGGGPGRAGLVANLKMIESIRPYAEQPGMAYILHEGELLVFPMSTAEQVRAEAIAALDKAARHIVQLNGETEYLMREHLRLNYEEQPYVGFVVSVFSREEPVDVQDRMLRKLSPSNMALTRYRNAAKRQSLAEMGDEMFTAAEFGSEAQEVVRNGIDKAISTAGAVVSTLTVVRDLSFAVALSIGAILAAPLVAAGAAGLGATGAGATALTAVGTGGVVGAEGYALGFTGTATGELVAGHSLRDALAAGHSEGVRVGKQGVSTGLGAGTAFGLTRNLGLAAGGLSRGATLVRTAAAQGGGNLVGGVSSGLLSPPEGMSRTEAALRGGGLGLLTAGIGAGSGVVAQSVRSPAAQRMISIGLPSAAEGGLTYLQTGDLSASLTAAGTSAATSALTHNRPTGLGPEMEARAFDAGQRARARIGRGVSSVVSGARMLTAATMIETADISSSPRLGASRTGYTLSSPDSGSVVAGSTPSRVQPNPPETQTPRPPSSATTPRVGQVTAPTAETSAPGPRVSPLRGASAQVAGAHFTYDYHAQARQPVVERRTPTRRDHARGDGRAGRWDAVVDATAFGGRQLALGCGLCDRRGHPRDRPRGAQPGRPGRTERRAQRCGDRTGGGVHPLPPLRWGPLRRRHDRGGSVPRGSGTLPTVQLRPSHARKDQPQGWRSGPRRFQGQHPPGPVHAWEAGASRRPAPASDQPGGQELLRRRRGELRGVRRGHGEAGATASRRATEVGAAAPGDRPPRSGRHPRLRGRAEAGSGRAIGRALPVRTDLLPRPQVGIDTWHLCGVPGEVRTSGTRLASVVRAPSRAGGDTVR